MGVSQLLSLKFYILKKKILIFILMSEDGKSLLSERGNTEVSKIEPGFRILKQKVP